MSRWYWGAVVSAALLVVSWLMPAYMTEEWGAVWPSQIGRGWNNRDADGNPLHDDLGNRIRPNPVRPVALVVFGVGAAALAGAGAFYPTKKRRPPTGSANQAAQAPGAGPCDIG
jgi:hypothetical protein